MSDKATKVIYVQQEAFDGECNPIPEDAELITITQAKHMMCERLGISSSTWYDNGYRDELTVYAFGKNPQTGKLGTFRVVKQQVERILESILQYPYKIG